MNTLTSTSKILPSLPPTTPTSTPACAHCSTPSKYTCPGCHTQTCSLLCTRTHKQSTHCSGIRDKAAYIPLNRYGWGSMMNDYCLLEEVGRKVGEVGREIVQGGFDMGLVSSMRGRGGGRGRGKGRGRGVGRGGKSKREMLKLHLEARGIEIELLPSGMERKQMNQSVLNPKNQTALLTIQFKFHPSSEALSSSSSSPNVVQPFTLLTHRNNIITPLLTLVQTRIQERITKKPTTSTIPPWISSLVIPPPEDPEGFTPPTFVVAAPSDPALLSRSITLLSPNSTSIPKLYYSLNPHEPLMKSLSGTQFVEFPLIEVWEKFNGIVVDRKTGSVRCAGGQEEPQRKRRKLNMEEGMKAINTLLGDYGSEDDEEEEGQVEDNHGNSLVGYADSDGGEGGGDMEQDNEGIPFELDEAEWSDADAEGEIDFEADPAILVELMRQAKEEGKWIEEEDEKDGDESDDPGF